MLFFTIFFSDIPVHCNQVFAWFSCDQITIEFIFGPTIKTFDIKTTMHHYLLLNLTYIDTEVFIPIPAPLTAREEVSGNAGILKFIYEVWHSANKVHSSPLGVVFSRNFPRRVREVSGKRRTFKNPCFPLSTQHLVLAIYFLHSADNKLRQYFVLWTPNDNFAISGIKVHLVCKSVFLSVFGSLELRLVNFKYILYVYNEK